MLHGSVFGFEAAFMGNITTGLLPPGHSMPVFMAEKGLDVWGMDLGWVFTPAEETDLSSYADWGLAREVDQIQAGLALARALRGLTAGDPGPMNYLGWSYGGFLGYVLLNEESQMPRHRRQVKAFIPADIPMKIDDAAARQVMCEFAAYYHQMQDSGVYGDGSAALFSYLGLLAIQDPLGESPVFPPLTNEQAALFFGTAPGIYFPYPQTFHLVAGAFDDQGLATGLQHMRPDYFYHYLLGAAPWAPTLTGVEQLDLYCNEIDSPYDDHLGDIMVPTLYVGAAGGVGEGGLYSTTLLGGTDVTALIVRLWPVGQDTMDFGHIDMWSADNAPSVLWQPIYDWLNRH